MKRTEEKINWKKAACAAALFFILLFAFWELGLKKGFPLYLAAPSAVLAEGLLVFLDRRVVLVKSRNILIGCAVFSALLALSFAIGGKASGKIFTSFTPWDVVLFLAVFAVSCPILIWCADVILRHPLSLRGKSRFSPLQVWLTSSAFLFLCWVSCLLIYYPGSVSPDSVACITRALGKARLSNQQPLFYILLMKPFLLLIPESAKDVTAGVAAFLACQTLAMAVMTGYLFGWLVRQGVPRWVILCTGAYFTFNPVFPLYAVTMWKDILFGGLAMIYVLNLIDIVRSSGGFLDRPRNMVWFLALNLLLAFMRNNGYYMIAVTLIVLGIVYRKQWKRLLPAFLAVLVAVPVIQGPVYSACGVEPSPFAESVGIPLQQVACTLSDGGSVTPEQRDFLNRLMPAEDWKKDYTPLSSNGIKFSPSFRNDYLEKHKAEFLKVWAGMMGPNRRSYFEAYVLETYGYWHIGTSSQYALYYGTGTGYGAQKYGVSLQNSNALMNSRQLNAMRAFISSGFRKMQSSFLPFGWMVSIAALFWLTVFSALLMLLRKKAKLLIPFLPLLILWGTLMLATPTYCEFRYMFAYAMALPVTLLLPFLPDGVSQKGSNAEKEASQDPA